MERTKSQLAFIKKHLPLPKYKKILDVCSGWGRIAGPLAWAGYEVTAIDRDKECVREGMERNPKVSFVELDMRRISALTAKFDAVICLWQSFGYFDEITNRRILQAMAGLLTPGGRIILDLYNRSYFAKRQGVEASTVAGARIDTERLVEGRRLRTRIDYGGGKVDDFDWEIYNPREAVELAAACGLKAVVLCANFDETVPPGDSLPAFQLVLAGE